MSCPPTRDILKSDGASSGVLSTPHAEELKAPGKAKFDARRNADFRDRILAEPGMAALLRAFAASTGLTVVLEELFPAPGGHGPPCRRMLQLGQRQILECVRRRAGLLDQVAGTGTSAAVCCPVGTFCLAVPIYALGIQVATLRAGGFTQKMGASKERANAVRELLLLAADELGRCAASLLAHPAHGSEAVNRAMNIIRSQSGKRLSLEDVATEAGVSRQHLARLWKKHIGVPLHSCLREIRLNRAKAMLEADNRKIIDVAMECGFGSISQFNRVFRCMTGVSPRRWITERRRRT